MTREEALNSFYCIEAGQDGIELVNQIYDEFENKDNTTFKDFTFTNCNDCKNKIDNKFTLICNKCKRFYGCHFEKR